jgi:hypothetical protein
MILTELGKDFFLILLLLPSEFSAGLMGIFHYICMAKYSPEQGPSIRRLNPGRRRVASPASRQNRQPKEAGKPGISP